MGPTQDRVLALIGELGLETMPAVDPWPQSDANGRPHSREGRLGPPSRCRRSWISRSGSGASTVSRAGHRARKRGRSSTRARWTRGWRAICTRVRPAAVVTIAAAATTGTAPEDPSLSPSRSTSERRGSRAAHRRGGGGAGIAASRAAVDPSERAPRWTQAVRLGPDVRAVLQGRRRGPRYGRWRSAPGRSSRVALDPALPSIDFGTGFPRPRHHLHQGWEMGTGFKFHVAHVPGLARIEGLGQLLADDGLVRPTFDATPEGLEGSPGRSHRRLHRRGFDDLQLSTSPPLICAA